MKTISNFRYAVLAMAAVIFASCAEDPAEAPEVYVETETVENPDYEMIRSMGYRTEGIYELEDRYVVEGDILIEKAYIDSLKLRPETRQARSKNLITGGREETIRVKLTSNIVPDKAWRRAIRDAVDIWNAVPNCRVRFYKIEQEILYADVRVEMHSDVDVAMGATPQNGRPGKEVWINPETIDHVNDTPARKVYILVHEFGHILGLKHTDYINSYANGVVNDNPTNIDFISGTPSTELLSVMHSHSAGREAGDVDSWTGFTAGDLAAIQATYGTPIWSRAITGPDATASWNPATYTLELGTNLIDLSPAWYVNNVFKGTDAYSFTPSSLSNGQNTLKASVSYVDKTYEATKVIDVYNPVISTSAEPSVNIAIAYRVPTPPAGVTFNGWTVTGGTYAYGLPGGLSSPTLNVTFTQEKQYTLTASFTAGGVSHTISKAVDMTLPAKPVIETELWGKVPGNPVKFTIENYMSAATYEWETVGELSPGGSDYIYINIPYTPPAEGWYIAARCRAHKGSYTTPWSEWSYVLLDYSDMFTMSRKDSLAMMRVMKAGAENPVSVEDMEIE